MKTAGYSGTPLAKKLGLKSNFRIKLVNQPDYYFNLFTDLPPGIQQIDDFSIKKDFIHYFTKNAAQFNKDIKLLRQELEEHGSIWISWPKKAAKVETDVTENLVRETALQNGLVDIKVCSVDATWSALKLVIRLRDRK